MQSDKSDRVDIAIVGGGMSGVTAALCFAQLGLSIAIIEAVEPELETSPSFDHRAVALSDSSVAIYRTLGLWRVLSPFACPIEQIHVSDRGHPGFTRLHASESNVEALGQVVPLELAGPALWREVATESLIHRYCPAKLTALDCRATACRLSIQTVDGQGEQAKQVVEAKLVIAADGTFSTLAQSLAIPIERKPYKQHAVIANIQTQERHHNRAFERFTASGPLALLPLARNQMSLVWCVKPDDIDEVMALEDDKFCARLQRAFGYRLGKITKVSHRFQYPLSLHLAENQYTSRVLLFGNAAHTLHPIAGQGLNLGLRDIGALNDVLRNAIINKLDFGCNAVLQSFVDDRARDWQQTVFTTDGLARLFSNDFLPLAMTRSKLMNWVDWFPPAKRYLATAAMGYNLRASRLARGIVNEPLVRGGADGQRI